MKLSIIDKIRMMFVIKNYSYYCHKEKGQVGTTLPDGELIFETNPEQIECRFVYKRKISREKWEEVLEYLDYKNIPEWEGEFEIDEEGTISYRMYTDVSETKDIAHSRLALMMIMATKMGKATAENICRIADGKVTIEEVCQADS